MRVALFCQSLLGDWNHGNAHFLRGVVTELLARRHDVRVYEPRDASSRGDGDNVVALARHVYPRIRPKRYDLATIDLEEALDDVDLVLVHHDNDPELVRRIGERRERPGSRFKALFHDAHHGAVSEELTSYDGVLAFGAAIRDVYQRRSLAKRTWVWHEAADPRVFFPVPPPPRGKDGDVVWTGEANDAELREFLLDPVRELGISARGLMESGPVPSFRVPDVFARFKCAVHIAPERFRAVPGVPSIDVFDALACAIPLVCSPWDDTEGLFTPGRDYLVARDGADMKRHLRLLANDAHARSELSRHGRSTILARHTCAHRVDELIAIAGDLGVRVRRPMLVHEGAVS